MGNPWLERRVLNYAHQGGAREAPSSTLFAMHQAVAAGAHALELDVHATADRHLVVCHDATVDRTTEGSGAIAAMTLDEVQALDNAYWWVPGEVVAPGRPEAEYVHRGKAPADPQFRIPSLAQVLETFPDVYLNLDIKQTAPTVEPYEELLATELRRFGRSDDVIVGSFLDGATATFASLAPGVSTSAGTLAVADFYRAVDENRPPPALPHHALQVPAAYEGTVIVDRRFVTAAHQAGLAVHVWTIDDEPQMRALLALGVDGIMTDCPAVLADLLARVKSVGS